MAINPLYGYDTTAEGYGKANRRQLPAWMQDMQARGIGTAQAPVTTMPGFIDIPRGNGLGGFNDQAAAPVSAPPPLVNVGAPGPAYGGEGNGAVGDISSNVSNQPAPGILADILGGLGLSTGTYGGSAGSNIDNQGKSGDLGAMNDLGAMGDGMGGAGSQGDLGGGKGTGDVGAMNGLARGGVVTANRLRGPDPAGPDDGYVAMDLNEGVITAAAMKHYGPAFLRRLNKLQVPKGR